MDNTEEWKNDVCGIFALRLYIKHELVFVWWNGTRKNLYAKACKWNERKKRGILLSVKVELVFGYKKGK